MIGEVTPTGGLRPFFRLPGCPPRLWGFRAISPRTPVSDAVQSSPPPPPPALGWDGGGGGFFLHLLGASVFRLPVS